MSPSTIDSLNVSPSEWFNDNHTERETLSGVVLKTLFYTILEKEISSTAIIVLRRLVD